MNAKIALSGLSIVAAVTMLGGAAFAAFTTQALANGNTFSVGTENLLISTAPGGPFTSSIPNPFTGTNIGPGYSHTFTFYLKNDNTTSTDNLDILTKFSGAGVNATLDPVLTSQFECTDHSVTTTGGTFNVSDMRAGSVSLGTINSGSVATCTVTVSLPSNVGNSIQGQTTQFDAEFDGSVGS